MMGSSDSVRPEREIKDGEGEKTRGTSAEPLRCHDVKALFPDILKLAVQYRHGPDQLAFSH